MGKGTHKMITYDLEYANEKEVKYSYYPWHDTDDKGYIVVSRSGDILEKKLAKADEEYPIYFNELVGPVCRNATSDSPEKHGCRCWM